MPVSTETLQLYAQFLSRTFSSVDSIKNYISGVRTMHLLLGINIDHINSFLVNLSLKGLSKLKLHMVKQAEPMTPQILKRIYHVLDTSSTEDTVYWCLFLFAFFLLARKSNLVPTSKNDLSNPKFLLRKDIEVVESDLLVNMKWTKTIQQGERVLKTPLTKIKDSCLCPVAAYQKMISSVPRSNDSPLFVLKYGKVITYSMYLNKLRSVIQQIGLAPELFSTHSFRRGFATLAFRLDLPADIIQLMGDWRSDAYKKYLQFSITDKIRVSEFIGKKLSELY